MSDVLYNDLPLPPPPAPPIPLRRFGPRGPLPVAPVAPVAAPPAAQPAGVTPEQINVDPRMYQNAPVDGGRVMAAPSEMGARDARAMLASIVSRLQGDGANQMVGYRLGAQLAADREGQQYADNVRRFNETSSADREQEGLRALTEAERQRRNAIRLGAVNNPAGAAAAAEGELAHTLVSPEARARIAALQQSQITENNAQAAAALARAAGVGGAGGAAARQETALTDRQQRDVNTEHGRLDTQQRAVTERYQRMMQQYQNNPLSFGASPEQQRARIAELEAERDRQLNGIETTRRQLPPRRYGRLEGGEAAPGGATPPATPGGNGSPAPGAAPQSTAPPPASAPAGLPPMNERVEGRVYQTPAGPRTWMRGSNGNLGWGPAQ